MKKSFLLFAVFNIGLVVSINAQIGMQGVIGYARGGTSRAQRNLEDPAQTFKRFKEAAEHGRPEAQWRLGRCYSRGSGVAKNDSLAAYWYRKAADQEYTVAQFYLGACYDRGYGVVQDSILALYWFKKAAVGYADAQFNIDILAIGDAGDYVRAAYRHRESAKSGYQFSQKSLAYLYFSGRGVELDYKQAASWFAHVAMEGDASSQCMLAFCYLNGMGVDKDVERAKMWFQKSASNGEDDAKKMLEAL